MTDQPTSTPAAFAALRRMFLPPAPTIVVVARSVDDCTGAYDCPGPHIDGCFAQTPESAEYAREHYTAPLPAQAKLLGMLDDVVIAAGEHQKAIADVTAARRLLAHSELEQALAAREVAQSSYQRTVAALRTAITKAVQA